MNFANLKVKSRYKLLGIQNNIHLHLFMTYNFMSQWHMEQGIPVLFLGNVF